MQPSIYQICLCQLAIQNLLCFLESYCELGLNIPIITNVNFSFKFSPYFSLSRREQLFCFMIVWAYHFSMVRVKIVLTFWGLLEFTKNLSFGLAILINWNHLTSMLLACFFNLSQKLKILM